MKIDPTETEIVGGWKVSDRRVLADDACMRIESLVASHLRLVGHDASGWYTLFRDPDDGRLWERWYPHSEMHGGGPPALRAISAADARERHGDVGERS